MHAWQAGAHVEDLRTRCPYFYEVALRLDALGHFEGLGLFVHSCFQRRYKVRATCPRCPWRLAHTGCSHIQGAAQSEVVLLGGTPMSRPPTAQERLHHKVDAAFLLLTFTACPGREELR